MINHQDWDYQHAVFVDETALIAFMNPEDPRYTKARSLFLDLHDLERNFMTTNSIIFDVHDWLRNEYGYTKAEFFLNVMDKAVSKGKLAVIAGDTEFEKDARRLLMERPELEFSLSEALTAIVMATYHTTRIFTFNSNFIMLLNMNKQIKVIPSLR
ncbi:type II toxin-antitoxin system VapC family toxin [Paenibacillus eucommiae]|uniref:Nucleic acid-binding protein n=1 Tax=Paenibacillus eucommiae TaxID=1355755 RepID=A0ABS4J959_9BACL|nr:type II toxin-antitoxin system VapC family toxin [Paenibacillus eucommiae]MBP1995249.1 putative nucleic acid-binding protein [Paenibacillus eucommiae]